MAGHDCYKISRPPRLPQRELKSCVVGICSLFYQMLPFNN